MKYISKCFTLTRATERTSGGKRHRFFARTAQCPKQEHSWDFVVGSTRPTNLSGACNFTCDIHVKLSPLLTSHFIGVYSLLLIHCAFLFLLCSLFALIGTRFSLVYIYTHIVVYIFISLPVYTTPLPCIYIFNVVFTFFYLFSGAHVSLVLMFSLVSVHLRNFSSGILLPSL